MSEEKKYVVDPPKPKPSKLRRAVEEIKSGVKKVGQEYKAGNIPLTIPSMVKNIKNKYRKTQISKPKFSNVQVPVGKPKQTRKPQTLKDGEKFKGRYTHLKSKDIVQETESQTFTKRQRPGRDKKETVKVNVVN